MHQGRALWTQSLLPELWQHTQVLVINQSSLFSFCHYLPISWEEERIGHVFLRKKALVTASLSLVEPVRTCLPERLTKLSLPFNRSDGLVSSLLSLYFFLNKNLKQQDNIV